MAAAEAAIVEVENGRDPMTEADLCAGGNHARDIPKDPPSPFSPSSLEDIFEGLAGIKAALQERS
jgi:hypothetical protein